MSALQNVFKDWNVGAKYLEESFMLVWALRSLWNEKTKGVIHQYQLSEPDT